MPSKDKRIHRLPIGAIKPATLSKVKNIEDLFTRADINGILNKLDKEKPDIDDLIVIWVNKKDELYFTITDKTLVSRATYMLEATKIDLLTGDD
jgi:hypothetical protein